MTPEKRTDAETASSLIARAQRCRALSHVTYVSFSAHMLQLLAQQLEGEAARRETGDGFVRLW